MGRSLTRAIKMGRKPMPDDGPTKPRSEMVFYQAVYRRNRSRGLQGEREPAKATIRRFRIVQTEGKRVVSRLVDHCNPDAILVDGHRACDGAFFGSSTAPSAMPHAEYSISNPQIRV